MRAYATLGIDYCHRFLGYGGEEQYLHGHRGHLIIEVGGRVNKRTNFVQPCASIKHIAWDYLRNFNHATIMQEEDPLLPGIMGAYAKEGIRHGAPSNAAKGPAFKNHLVETYPECGLVVVKKMATCENLLEIFYSLLRSRLDIRKMTFTSGNDSVEAEPLGQPRDGRLG